MCVQLSSHNKFIVSGSADETIRLWKLKNKKNLIIGKHNDWVYSISISYDNKLIASGSADKTVRCWTIKTNEGIIIGKH